MTKKNKIRQLSANNNCLSADTINSFLTGRLNTKEMKLARKHINECEFCADAVEGYKNIQIKDTLLNTVKQLNKKIDVRSSQGIHRFLSINKKIIAYSSLAASVLILMGLFLLINNLKFQHNNIVTDNLILKEDKQPSPEEQKKNKETGSLVTYDSFPRDNDSRRKIALKEDISAVTSNEISTVTSKTTFKSYDKSETKDIMEQEAIDNIAETEVDKEIEEAKYHGIKLTGAPAARAAEISDPSIYDTDTGRNKTRFARKGYSQPQEILTIQMQSGKNVLYDEAVPLITDELPSFGNNGLEHFKEYVQKNLQYPRRAKKLRIEGEVSVKFAIDTTGRVVDTEIINSADSLLNKEALRVVNSSPEWTPGKQDGKPVKVSYVIPVIFKID